MDCSSHLAPMFETLDRVKTALAPEKTLIGFCGSPWTVATYMIAGRGSPDQAAARLFALQHPEAFAQLMDMLVEAVDRLSGRRSSAPAPMWCSCSRAGRSTSTRSPLRAR